jgi:lipid-binding SYLF domain-containing protein/peptidoglycan hydrolase-like protein with peptidoglycan-binding domain
MSVSKLGIILFSSFLIFATAPLASAQSTQDQTQDQTTKKKQKSTTKKETGKTTQQNAPASENKAGSTEKSEAGKAKKSKKTSSLSSDKIRQAQMSLKDQGFDPGPIDGVMGPMTMTALRNYQSHNKLPVTGTLTPETESALLQGASAGTKRSSLDQEQQTYSQDQTLQDKASSLNQEQAYGQNKQQTQTFGNETTQTRQSLGTNPEPAASSVKDVKQIQMALVDLGYNPGEVNGMMSADTQQSIREFQYLNNLPVTGIVDQETKTALESQGNGSVQNARLGETPLSAEREKPFELQQNRTDSSYNQTQNQKQNQTDTYDKNQNAATDPSYKKDQTDHSKHHDQATGKHGKEAADRIMKSAEVLRDITTSPDNGIPNDLLERAEAIVVIPHVVKGAFVIGGRYGKGVASERLANGRWSPPAFMEIGGGSFGLQIGASATDLVLVFTDRKALDTLENGKDLKLGVDAGIVAGPIGRSAEAGTNAKLESAIYAYSRSKGLFAGVALDGAVLYTDNDMNRRVYGDSVDSKQVLTGKAAANSTVRPFMNELEKVVPKKRITHYQPPSESLGK